MIPWNEPLGAVPSYLEARELARDLARKSGKDDGPSSAWLLELCLFVRVRVILRFPRQLADRHSALMQPSPDGWFEVFLRSTGAGGTAAGLLDSSPRHCFLLAHEIGHSLFYHRGISPPRRFAPYTAAEEFFCDQFAAELLGLPHSPLWDGTEMAATYP